MAINKNHEFEDLNGVKCALVEKLVPADRVLFLQTLLEYNGYTVIIVASPAPKPVAAAAKDAEVSLPVTTPAAETFTVGVTDVSFNAINAIFGRILRTPDGHIVTLGYWRGKDSRSQDEIPYFGNVD